MKVCGSPISDNDIAININEEDPLELLDNENEEEKLPNNIFVNLSSHDGIKDCYGGSEFTFREQLDPEIE